MAQMLERQAKKTIHEYHMLSGAKGVVCALSGGADSVALLLVMQSLSVSEGFFLSAAHVHHGIRGTEADKDAVFCRSLCERLGVLFFETEVDVPAEAKAAGIGLEEAGRNARYRVFEEAAARSAREWGLPAERVRVALAHHANDSAETQLFCLTRGTGLSGLGGIPPVRGRFIRPLIACTRAEIRRYLSERGQVWREDLTNQDTRQSRSRIRHDVLPVLEAENPQTVPHMLKTAEDLRRIEVWLRQEAEALLAKYETVDGALPAEILKAPEVPAEEAAGQWLTRHAPGSRRVHREAAIRLLVSGAKKGQFSLPGGRRLLACDGILRVMEPADSARGGDAQIPLASDGRPERIPAGERDQKMPGDGGDIAPDHFRQSTLERAQSGWLWRLPPLEEGVPVETEMERLQFCFLLRPARPNEAETAAGEGASDPFPASGRYTKVFDYDKINTVCLRMRRPQDTLLINGHTKKLRRLFIDAAVPAEVRGRLPLLCDASRVLLVPGVRMSDDAKLSDQTVRVLEVRVSEGATASHNAAERGSQQ